MAGVGGGCAFLRDTFDSISMDWMASPCACVDESED